MSLLKYGEQHSEGDQCNEIAEVCKNTDINKPVKVLFGRLFPPQIVLPVCPAVRCSVA